MQHVKMCILMYNYMYRVSVQGEESTGNLIIMISVHLPHHDAQFLVRDITVATYAEWTEFAKYPDYVLCAGKCSIVKTDGTITFDSGVSSKSAILAKYPLGNFEDALQKCIDTLHDNGLLRE